jgi:trans-aconitate methyltransferase
MGEWNADVYHRVSDPQAEWGRSVLARLPLQGDELVLDVGCGTGRLTADLLARLPRGKAVGVDLSSNMLGTARANLRTTAGTARIAFVLAHASALPFAGTADAIFSTAAFHWVKDHDRLFASLFSTLKPLGRLVAQCGGAGNIERVHERCQRLGRKSAFRSWFQESIDPWEFADANTTAARLARAGFVDIQTAVVATPIRQPDARSYRDFVEHVIARSFLARIGDAGHRDQFMTALTDWAARDTPPFELDYWRLNIDARRPSSDL